MEPILISAAGICLTILVGVFKIGHYLSGIETKLEALTTAFEHHRKEVNSRLNHHSDRIRDLERGEPSG